MSNILVTGGSGLVGKSLKKVLPTAAYVSSQEYDLLVMDDVANMLEEHNPSVVVHLAARVGGIIDNINNPVDFLEHNIIMNTNILRCCHRKGVDRVISMLSTCAYPDYSDKYPLVEEDLFNGPPTATNFSYGFSKRCMATHIDSYVSQFGKKWSYLIPCNLYGEGDKYEEKQSHFVSSLIRKIYENNESIELWGTGRPLRQFMYAGDLARVIRCVIENEISGNFNVAPAQVHSIDEIAKIGILACDKENLIIKYDNNYPDGQFRKDVDSSRLLSVLEDFKFTSLSDGISLVYDDYSKQRRSV